jgi:hypothetical protein
MFYITLLKQTACMKYIRIRLPLEYGDRQLSINASFRNYGSHIYRHGFLCKIKKCNDCYGQRPIA